MSTVDESEVVVVQQPDLTDDRGDVLPQDDSSISDVRVLNTGQGTATHPITDGGVGLQAQAPLPLPGYELPQLVMEADKNKWALPQALADYFSSQTRLHMSDKDWTVNMENYPPPSNVDVVPIMDNNFKRLLKDEGQNAAIDIDQDLSTLQKRVTSIMGPLGKAWARVAQFRSGELEELDTKELLELLGMSSVAVAHTMQKLSYHRRVTSLSALGKVKNVKDILREEKVQKIFQVDTTNSLFPKEFDDLLKTEKGSRSNILATFKQPTTSQKKKETKGKTAGAAGSSSSATRPPPSNDRRFIRRNQPFSSFPSNQGGGYRKDDRNRPPFAKGQGKHVISTTSGQHAFFSELVTSSPTCPPQFEVTFSHSGSDISIGGENPKVLGQLEADHQRPSDLGYCQGMGDSSSGHPYPNEVTARGENEQTRRAGNRQGDRKHVGQRGDQGSHTQVRPIFEQHLCYSKRGGPVSSNNKSETTQHLRSLPSFQDGGSEGREAPPKKGRLDVQVRPERRILLRSPGNEVSEVCQIPVERETLRVPLSSIRPRSSTKNFHQADESPSFHHTETRDNSGDLLRRHAHNRTQSRGTGTGEGHRHVSLLPSRTDN